MTEIATETMTGDPAKGKIGEIIRLLRPHQWVKNILLALPLTLSHDIDAWRWGFCLLGMATFCALSSAIYVLNDRRDVEHDRHHPKKMHRPFAAGTLPLSTVNWLVPLLLILAVAFSVPLAKTFWAVCGGYMLFSLLYINWLKEKLLVDVFALAGLYTLRVMAGGAATHTMVSPWLLAFSLFMFLSLAFIKRYKELMVTDLLPGERLKGRVYAKEDLDIIQIVGPCSGYLAVLVMALYIQGGETVHLHYNMPTLLWLICPLILYWITRLWFIARRGHLSDDPVAFALRDKVSWYTALSIIVLGALASIR